MSQETSAPLVEAPAPRRRRRTKTVSDASMPPERPEPRAVVAMPGWKRAIDVAGSLVALIVLSPLFLLAALYIRLVSPGPVFFRQPRAGLLGQPFEIWKFRTMKTNTNSRLHQDYVGRMMGSDATAAKLDERDFIIPLGGLLRGTCLDELPQLLNVLRGDMSLVGPRPDVIDYEDYQLWQRRRFDVPPGMTGLWQVSGKNRTTFAEMMELDIRYVEQRSFWLDARILLKTIPAIACECVRKKVIESPN